MGEPDWLTDEVFIVDELLPADECRRLIEQSENLGYEQATVTSPQGDVVRKDIRNNERLILDDPQYAKMLWALAEEGVPAEWEGWRAAGLNPRFRYYRYDAGQQFDWHQDATVELDDGRESRLTCMVYLNGGFEGGETSFDDSCSAEPFETFQVTPATGLGLFFAHNVWHKGEPVLSGRKYVLRTDVLYRPRRKRRRGR